MGRAAHSPSGLVDPQTEIVLRAPE